LKTLTHSGRENRKTLRYPDTSSKAKAKKFSFTRRRGENRHVKKITLTNARSPPEKGRGEKSSLEEKKDRVMNFFLLGQGKRKKGHPRP